MKNRASIRFMAMAALIALVCMMGCTKKNAYLDGPASMVPGSTYAMITVSGLEQALNPFGGSMDKLLDQAKEYMKNAPFDKEQIKKEILDKVGFDPLNPQSYHDMGINTAKPLAIVLPSLSLAARKPEILFLLPVDDAGKFGESLQKVIQKMVGEVKGDDEASKMLKVSLESKDDMTAVNFVGETIFLYKVEGGYARIALDPGTVKWSMSAKSKKDSLGGQTEFINSIKGAPQTPVYWMYLNPKLLELGRSALETAARVDGGAFREWMPGSQGIIMAYGKDANEEVSFVSLPAPTNENFRKIFETQPGLADLLKKLPPDPMMLAKVAFNYSAFYGVIKDIVSKIPKARKNMEKFEEESPKELGFRVNEDLLASLASGALFLYYINTDFNEPIDPEKMIDMLTMLLLVPIKDAEKMKTVLPKAVELIEKDEKMKFAKLDMEGTDLYVYDINQTKIKARQSEARTNLASLFTAEIAFFAENSHWGSDFDMIGWSPYGENRYSYYISCTNCYTKFDYHNEEGNVLSNDWVGTSCQTAIPSKTGGPTECPDVLKEALKKPCEQDNMSCFRVAAVGNIDDDKTPDIWVIDENKSLQNISDDVADGTPGKIAEGPQIEFIFGSLGSNLVLTNSRDMIDDLVKGVQGPSAYDLAAKANQTAALTDSGTTLSIMQMGQWGKLMSNIKLPEGEEPPFDFKMFAKLFPSDMPSSGTMSIDGDSLVSRGTSSMMTVSIIGIAAAIAIPNFLKYQAKARSSEAKTNLASIATAEIAFFAETNAWGTGFDTIGWSPTGKTKYSYYLSCNKCATKYDTSGKAEITKGWIGNNCQVVIPSSATGYEECPAELKEWLNRPCDDEYGNACFRAGAVGNIDNDDTLDIWGIDDQKWPQNLSNDVAY